MGVFIVGLFYTSYTGKCLLKQVIEQKIEGRIQATERRKQLLGDCMEERKY
jgi:hypothetical protein